jgi:hypothetical protein
MTAPLFQGTSVMAQTGCAEDFARNRAYPGLMAKQGSSANTSSGGHRAVVRARRIEARPDGSREQRRAWALLQRRDGRGDVGRPVATPRTTADARPALSPVGQALAALNEAAGPALLPPRHGDD